jgi:hypothetical protein
MARAPKTHNACQSPGSAIVIANTGTRIERPITSPATKLAASGNLARGLFMISLVLVMMAVTPGEVGALARLMARKVTQRLAGQASQCPTASCGSVRYRTDTAAYLSQCGQCVLPAAGRYSSQCPMNGLPAYPRNPPGPIDRKEIEIPTQLRLPARVPMWLVAASSCLLAGSVTVAIIRSIPGSYASIPDESITARDAAAGHPADARFTDAKAQVAKARATINRRNRAPCPDCGVVESVREIERPEVVGRQDILDTKVAGRVSGDAIVAGAIAGRSYEITVRFRDGSTTVFNEADPRAWRMGSRVIVIGRSTASN